MRMSQPFLFVCNATHVIEFWFVITENKATLCFDCDFIEVVASKDAWECGG